MGHPFCWFAEGLVVGTGVVAARARAGDWCVPVAVRVFEVFGVVAVEHGAEEEEGHVEVTGLLEAAVGGVDRAIDDGEAERGDLAGEVVVLCEESFFGEAAEGFEAGAIHEKEHAGAEGAVPGGEMLREVGGAIEEAVGECAGAAMDVYRGAVQGARAHGADGAADEGGVGEFDVCVEEEDEGGDALFRAVVAGDGGKATGDDGDVEVVLEVERELYGAVGGVGVSNEYFRRDGPEVVLPAQRGQEPWQVVLFVLRGDDDGEFGYGIHGGALLVRRR